MNAISAASSGSPFLHPIARKRSLKERILPTYLWRASSVMSRQIGANSGHVSSTKLDASRRGSSEQRATSLRLSRCGRSWSQEVEQHHQRQAHQRAPPNQIRRIEPLNVQRVKSQ